MTAPTTDHIYGDLRQYSPGFRNALAMARANTDAPTIGIYDGTPLSEAFLACCRTSFAFTQLQTSSDVQALDAATDAHSEATDAFDALLNAEAAVLLDSIIDDTPLIALDAGPVEKAFSECLRAYEPDNAEDPAFVAACARFNVAVLERVQDLRL